MEDFAVWALSRTLAGTFPLAVYQEIGIEQGGARRAEAVPSRARRRAATRPPSGSTSGATCMTASSVTCARSGLITDRIAPSLQSFGLKLAAA